MKTKVLVLLAALLAVVKVQAQFIVDCTCLAQQPGLTVTNCQTTIPDLCAVVTNCFRGTVVPPPPIPPFQCSQTPPAGTPVGPGTYVIQVTVQLPGVPPSLCTVPFQVVAPNVGQFTLQCAPDKTESCGVLWNFDPPTPVNPCCPNAAQPNGGVTITVTSTTTNGSCPQVITRTWQGVDNCGQTSTCSQTVTVVDNIAPTIACIPNKVVECGSNWLFDPPSAADNCSVTISVLSTTTNGACPEVITRTWEAADSCGNKSICSQTVTVRDTTPPTLDCACLQNNPAIPLTVIACSNGIPDLCLLAIGPAPSCGRDTCGPLTCSQSPAAGTIVGPGTYSITVTITDCAGNTASCVVNFTVIAPPGGCDPCPNQTNTWNTGMSGPSGNVSLAPGTPDPNYSLVTGPGGCTGPAQVLNPGSLPVGPWVANGPNSQWIGGGPLADCDPGVYHYRVCFYLPCTDGASVIGQWAVDDNATMLLNGQPTGNTIPSLQYPNLPGYGWFPVSITNGFVCGTNCLDFYVTNANIGINPTGFRAELTNFFNDCCCPPPKPISTVFSGIDANGPLALGAPDTQFALTCAPAGVTITTPVAVNPHPSWVPNGPNSQWIGVDPSNDGPPGVYCYEMRFNIPCPPGTPIKASLTGQWTADDWAEMHLNGQPTGHTVPSIQFPNIGFNGWHPINITSGFVPGLNTLTFYVTNAGGPTGLRLELTNSASCCDCTNICTVSIACPPDIIRETCGTVAHILYPLPNGTSSCNLPVNVVCVPPSNSVLPLGTTTVTCTATDSLGNTASCNFKVIVLLDATPPVIDCTCVQAAVPPRVNACFYTVPDLCQLTSCFSDNCTLPGQLICTQSPPAGTVLPAGSSYIITLTVTDAAGNVSAPCQVGVSVIAPTDTRVWNTGGTGSQAANFTVIQTPGGPANIPAVLTQPATGFWLPNDANSSWVSFTPNSSAAAVGVYIYRLTFNIPCTNGASIDGRFMSDDTARIWLNGVPTAALSTSFSTWTPVSLTTGFVPGLNTLDIHVTNATVWTGIRAELTNTFNCCCPQAIALNCPRTPVRGWVCGDGLANVPFNVTASSLCPTPGVTVSVTCVPPSPGPFPVGTTTVNCTATDSLGNTTSCSFPVVVVSDTIPPVITCPGPITRVLCANSVAVYYKVRARDDCSPTVNVTCVPPSGTVFTAGTTIVTCTATDGCGNTATCSFPVKIINNLIWQTLPSGINDCYAQSGWEPNSPGACLNTAYPGGNWKNYDITTVNRWVGHTWNFPVSWNILGAQLATRARPPINGCSGISGNDSIQLGLANCTTPSWLWSRYLGSGNASPGLVDKQWCNGSGCQYLFNFDLALMPLTPSGTISLLPHMNSTKRLDLFFQDDTTVDFANLRVLRCAPSHVIGGLGVELASAKLVYGPINWCLVPVDPVNPNFQAIFSVGEADGLRLPIEPLMLADHPGSALALGEVENDVPVDRLRVALQADGSAVVSLGELPAGVTRIDVEIEVNGQVVQSFPNIPVTSGQPLVSFPGTEPLIELATENGNEVLASILSQEPGLPAEKQTLRVRHHGRAKTSEAEVNLNAVGLPEIGIQQPEVQYTAKGSTNKPVKVVIRGGGFGNNPDDMCAVIAVSGGQAVLSPFAPASNAREGFTAQFPPTDEFRAVVPSPFGTFGPVPANAELSVIVRGIIDQDDDGDGVPTRVEGDVDRLRFTASADSSYAFDFTWSSARVHPVRKIYWVYGPSGAARLEFPGNSNVVVNLAELPVMHGKLGGRTPCRRIIWPKPTQLRVAGQEFEATELRVLVEVDNYPVTALTGLRLEAIGAESLQLAGVETGPDVYQLDAPEFTPDGLFLRWSGFGGLLQEATDLLGPWVPTPGQFEQTQGEVLTPHDPATPSKFFRVRGL